MPQGKGSWSAPQSSEVDDLEASKRVYITLHEFDPLCRSTRCFELSRCAVHLLAQPPNTSQEIDSLHEYNLSFSVVCLYCMFGNYMQQTVPSPR